MLILVSLKKFSSRKKVNKRIIYVGLIIGVSYWISRLDGSLIKFFSNRLLLFNKQFKFLGTRIYGSILKEIRIKNLTEKKNKKYFQKIFSYSSSAI
jgi:large subunit ribosomal protein L14